MSEADYSMLFQAHGESAIDILFGFFSVTSAFLAAVYMAGKDFPKLLAVVVVGLYSFTAITLIGLCERHISVLIAAQQKLKQLGATWHPLVNEPDFVLPVMTYLIVVSMGTVFLASVWYFVHVRRAT
jgi:hypothetical protein